MRVKHPLPPGELALYLGVAFATTVGHSGLVSLPFEVGAIADGLGLDARSSSLLVTVELVAYSLTNLLIAPYIGRLSTRHLAVGGNLLMIAALLASAISKDIAVFTISRAAAGIGFGVVFACANAVGAIAQVPERAYSVGVGVSIVFYTMLPLGLSRSATLRSLAPHWVPPHAGVFLAMAVFALLMLPTMGLLPREPTGPRDELGAISSPSPPVIQVAGALLVMALFSIGVFSPYTFMERHAHSIGMPAAQIGLLFSISFGVGLIGTFASTWLGRSAGLVIPLVAGLIAQALSCVAIALSNGEVAMFASTILFMIAWLFVYPYVFALGAAIDPIGRLSTAIGGVYLVGSSIAASFAGLLVQHGSYASLGWVACGLCVAAAAVGLWVAIRDRTQTVLAPVSHTSVNC